MEAKRLGLSTISTALEKFSTTFVKNAFKPLASLASPLTTGTTSSQAQENDWVSPPVPVMISSLPPSNAPAQRSNLWNKKHQTVIHWAGRRDYSEFMHDCYGGILGKNVLPTCHYDSEKHPWNEHLLIDLCKIRINCVGFADKYYVERWIRAIAKGISVSLEAFLRYSLTYPPDVVDDSQEHMDNTHMDSAKQEDIVEETDDEFEQKVFQYEDNYDKKYLLQIGKSGEYM
jgi:hypothetical protein